MRILVVEPERRPKVREINGTLKAMQAIVGGYIQPIYPFDEAIALVCNDEGKLMNLPANRALRGEEGQIYDIVFGTFFLCAVPKDGDSFAGLTEEQVKRYEEKFHTPEIFLNMGSHIICLPLEID